MYDVDRLSRFLGRYVRQHTADVRSTKPHYLRADTNGETEVNMKAQLEHESTTGGSSSRIPFLNSKQWLSLVEFFVQLKVGNRMTISIHQSLSVSNAISLLLYNNVERLFVGRITS